MANHPNRGWRKRWKIDVDAKTATHDSGFTVSFKRESEGWRAEVRRDVAEVHRDDVKRMIDQAGELFKAAARRWKFVPARTDRNMYGRAQ